MAIAASIIAAIRLARVVDLDMSPEQIASDYRLKLNDVRQVLAYYARHATPTLVP